MTRAALTALFILAALVIATPRPAPVIPADFRENALGQVAEPDQGRTGAPTVRDVFDGQSAPSRTAGPTAAAGAPSPSSANFSARPSRSLPPVAACSGKPTPKPLKRKEVRTDANGQSNDPSPKAGHRVSVPVAQPGRLLTGTASWFCLPGRSACTSGYPASGAYAAAGPRLRAALGDWRGRTVLVTANGVSVQVRLTDWCRCDSGYLLDLYASVFGQLARNGLSQGVVDVTVSW